MQRHEKVRRVEEESLRARSLLRSRIDQKMERSVAKKDREAKERVEKKVKERKLKEELFGSRRGEITDHEWRHRLEQFRQIKAGLNDGQGIGQW